MHLDTGALALGALPAVEREAVEAHVETCDACRVELAGFRETVARLAAVAAEAPPASLRRSVLAAIAVTPQLPPVDRSAGSAVQATGATEGTAEPPGGRHRRPGGQGPSGDVASATDGATGRPDDTRPDDTGSEGNGSEGTGRDDTQHDDTGHDDTGHDDTVPDNVRTLRPWYRRPVAWIAAAAAAVIVGGGLVAVNQFRGEQQVAQTPEQCVATAADRTQLTPDSGQGTVIYAPSCAAVTVDVSGLPALPDDRTYQLWALSEQPAAAPRSLGVLPAAATGQPQSVTQLTQPGENAVAITAEPAGGSVTPTFPIVWMTELSS